MTLKHHDSTRSARMVAARQRQRQREAALPRCFAERLRLSAGCRPGWLLPSAGRLRLPAEGRKRNLTLRAGKPEAFRIAARRSRSEMSPGRLGRGHGRGSGASHLFSPADPLRRAGAPRSCASHRFGLQDRRVSVCARQRAVHLRSAALRPVSRTQPGRLRRILVAGLLRVG